MGLRYGGWRSLLRFGGWRSLLRGGGGGRGPPFPLGPYPVKPGSFGRLFVSFKQPLAHRVSEVGWLPLSVTCCAPCKGFASVRFWCWGSAGNCTGSAPTYSRPGEMHFREACPQTRTVMPQRRGAYVCTGLGFQLFCSVRRQV